MTDAHTHLLRGESQHFLCLSVDEPLPPSVAATDVIFRGVHPWLTLEKDFKFDVSALEDCLRENPRLGVGEIGLDRLKVRQVPEVMRDVFFTQLELAAAYHRPVVLHGAKCWGEVVKACQPYVPSIPAFLFHGFSRSVGLLRDIVSMNGYVSVGPALLNDHAVNYRELARAVPEDRLLVESDATDPSVPHIEEIARRLADLRHIDFDRLSVMLAQNAAKFSSALSL